MKKFTLFAGMCFCSSLFAAQGDQTLSVGFAQMNSDGLKSVFDTMAREVNLNSQADASAFGAPVRANYDGYSAPRGGFIRYRYEVTNQWGLITAATYATEDGAAHYQASKSSGKADKDYLYGKGRVTGDYVSLMAGPTYRINDFLSLYAMTGASYQKFHSEFSSSEYRNDNLMSRRSTSSGESNYSIAWSLGGQVNVYKGLVVDASYEGSGRGKFKTNGFTVGLGYKF